MDQSTSAPRPFLLRLAQRIVKLRVPILLLTLAAMVFCGFSTFWVKTDTSLASFLSDDDEARRGLNIMAQEFQTYATAQVMVENVSEQEAAALKETLAGLDGVALVRYDPATDYRENAALYNVTLRGTEEDAQVASLDNVRAAVADYYFLAEDHHEGLFDAGYLSISDRAF